MAEKKRQAAGRTSSGKSAAGKKAAASGKSSGRQSAGSPARQRSGGSAKKTDTAKRKQSKSALEEREALPAMNPGMSREVMIWFLLALAVLMFISLIGFGGYVGGRLADILFGIFGTAAYALPFLLFLLTLFLSSNRGNRTAAVKAAAGAALYIDICAVIHLSVIGYTPGHTISEYAQIGTEYHSGGGLVGGALTAFFCPAIGVIGAAFTYLIIGIISIALLTQKTPFLNASKKSSEAYREHQKRSEERKEQRKLEREYLDAMEEDEGGRAAERPERQSHTTAAPAPDPDALSPVFFSALDKNPDARKPGPALNLSGKSRKKPPVLADEGSEEKGITFLKISRNGESTLEKNGDDTAIAQEGNGEDVSLRKTIDTRFGGNSAQESRPARAASFSERTLLRSGSSEKKTANVPAAASSGLKEEPAGMSAPAAAPGVSFAIQREGSAGPAEDEYEDQSDSGQEDSIWMKPEQMKAVRKGSVAGRVFSDDTASAAKTERAGSASGGRDQTASGAAGDGQKKKVSAAEADAAAQEVGKEIEQQKEEEAVPYTFPPIDYLSLPPKKRGGQSDEELRETAEKLQTILKTFGVNATVTNVSCGPSVTRYELMPELGVKVSRIVSLADDIKLNLAAADIRIEAPIPGKAAVGIEVPNKETSMVSLRELIDSDEFRRQKAKSKISYVVGKDIAGRTIVSDIAKMPHLLIAGATGSGKSVFINTLIMSIIYEADPSEVKMIMVDPKVVELSVYNGIPHLFIPVVTDPKKAAGALNWAVAEMTKRYQLFANYGVRNLAGFNAKAEELKKSGKEDAPEKMPQIVIIVDELADLMMVSGKEVEDAICRLAQLARACGIHLVIATQRPSVDVITGLIKANIPSRIAFAVSSGTDSRTIIDMNGAEKLLGNGDMLFSPQTYKKPVRVQGAFVSDDEIAAVVDFIKAQNPAGTSEEKMKERLDEVAKASAAVSGGTSGGGGNDGQDELFADAGRFLIQKDKASIGMLQRWFKIGFNRAGRIMDQLAEAGVVSEDEGTKPRRILMSEEQFENYLEQN